jgi:hypothetical protein
MLGLRVFGSRRGIGSVRTSSAPSCLRASCFSLAMVRGMQQISLYPLALHTWASPMPVLPDVASVMVHPGLISPFRSASSIRCSAGRSLTDPLSAATTEHIDGKKIVFELTASQMAVTTAQSTAIGERGGNMGMGVPKFTLDS